MQDTIVLTSKITIPTLGVDVVPRPGLQAKLAKIPQYFLTVVIAGAGYGKTTALVQYLSDQPLSVGWYNPGPEDDNVYIFSAYLAGALNSLLPGLKGWFFDKTATEDKFDWKMAFSILMAGIEFFGGSNAAGILVIDDWQYAQADAEIRLFFDRFLACCPHGIRVVILSREPIGLPEAERMRAKGRVLDFAGSDLTFVSREIEKLFHTIKDLPISKEQVQKILECTEGWVIAIKLLANQWQGRAEYFIEPLSVEAGDLSGLFEYLAHDVLERQSPELQNFLLQTAIAESFTLSYCKEILDSERSQKWLNVVLKKGLFIYRIGQGVYRYHTLFREFLCREAEIRLPDLAGLYSKIGYYYWKRENADRALHFLILGEQWEMAETILCEFGRRWVSSGRDRLLTSYLEQLPARNRQHPEFYLALGDAARFACLYEQAIDWYKKAGQQFQRQKDLVGWSQSCRGIGEVYLDIIQPSHAQSYLRQAYQVLRQGPFEEKGVLLGLMAENMINQGDSRRAELYRRLMAGMVPYDAEDKNNLQVRILLRTGRLGEVIKILERKYKEEQTTYHVPRSFRESPLVLSLCYTFIGQADRALELAQAGIESAEKLRSPFVAAIGYVRRGHALLLNYRQNRDQCQKSYQKALNLAEELGIIRGKTEVHQGRCLMYALDGNWTAAKRVGTEGIGITEKVHDDWFTAVLYHTLGMGAALCGCYDEANEFSKKALHLFQKCRDWFGQSACYWWLTFQAYHIRDSAIFVACYTRLLEYCERYDYGFLLEKPSFLGDVSGFSSEPFKKWFEELNSREPNNSGNEPAKTPLTIQALGPLKVKRYGQEVSPLEWRRAGAKQLLNLLLTLRISPATKGKLMLHLWPDADEEAAARSFKVVFNNLSNVLEPERKPRTACRFIVRKAAAYQLIVSPECQVDVEQFEALLVKGRSLLSNQPEQAKGLLLTAMDLYQGEYLAGENLDEISLRERERLELLAVQGAEMLASLYIDQADYDQAIAWTERILPIDACWERAYQLKLTCYGEQGNRVLLERTFRRCLAMLETELGVEPSLLTKQIYEKYQQKG